VAKGGRVALRLTALRARGADGLEALPDRKELAGGPPETRREVLDGLRVELYALTALLADAIMRRVLLDRASYPPYGLARSMFSEWGMLKVHPEPYEEGSITSFFELWKALVDTTVLHLHRELGAQRHADLGWVVERLDALVPLFSAGADRRTLARLRDTQTFLYGGMQFGSSVCVQLAEVMSRRLAALGLPPAAQRKVMARSVAPAHRLAAMSQEGALRTYRNLLSAADDTPEEGRDRPGWFDAGRFAVQESDGAPHSVVLAEGSADDDVPAAYTPLGCPARLATTGDRSPIAGLWRWCVDVCADTGLLADRGGRDPGRHPG
jgi:hypothetical protein